MIYNVLIVDDEEIITDSLYSFLSNKDDWELDVFKAYSAQEALGVSEKNRLDIMITDICMPGMNGLVLIKKIMEIWPDCRFIILTGHNEFEYAYEAIQMDRVRYILKTEGYEVIHKEVEKAVSEIENEKDRTDKMLYLEDRVKRMQPVMQQAYLREVLFGQGGKSLGSADAVDESLEMDTKRPVLMLLGRIDDDISIKSYDERNMIYNTAFTVIKESMGEHIYCVMYFDRREIIWLLQPVQTDSKNQRMRIPLPSYLWEVLPRIQSLCLRRTGITFSYIMADEMCTWKELCQKRRKIFHGFNYSIGLNKGILIRENQISYLEPKQSSELSMVDIQYMKECIQSGEYAGFMNAFQQHTEWMRQGTDSHDPEAIGIYCALVMIIAPYISVISIQEDIPGFNASDFLGLPGSFCWSEVLDRFSEFVKEICARQESTRDNDSKLAVDRVKLYVMEHYHEELSLSHLAEQVYLNPSYLSRIFRENVSMTLQNFILDTRLSHAKRLLVTTTQQVQDVARSTGFTSAKYFSTVFKQKTRMTPNEWRTHTEREKR